MHALRRIYGREVVGLMEVLLEAMDMGARFNV